MTSLTSAGPARRSRRARALRALPGYLFIAPAGLFVLVFSVIAIVLSFYISFFDWGVISPNHQFVGLANFQEALYNDDVFWIAARNTVVYAVCVVPGTVVGALVLALIGTRVRVGRSIFRTLYFIPSITPMVVISLVWIWMYSSDGLVNLILKTIHLPTFNWLLDERTALVSVIGMSIWAFVGYYMVLFLAGLADIPQVYFDAAQVDGATRWQTFWQVTLPLLRNTLIFVVVILTIGAFQVFTQVYVMTKGGPANATQVMQLLIYHQGFEELRMGYASALSWYLFVVVAIFSAIQMKIFRSQQIY